MAGLSQQFQAGGKPRIAEIQLGEAAGGMENVCIKKGKRRRVVAKERGGHCRTIHLQLVSDRIYYVCVILLSILTIKIVHKIPSNTWKRSLIIS